jgi:hypothetical protein
MGSICEHEDVITEPAGSLSSKVTHLRENDGQLAAPQGLLVHGLPRLVGLASVREFYEAKPTRPAIEVVQGNINIFHDTIALEQRLYFIGSAQTCKKSKT